MNNDPVHCTLRQRWVMWLLLTMCAWAYTLGAPHDLATPALLDDPLFTWTLDRGTVFDVRDDTDQIAGFVFVGTSRWIQRTGSDLQARVLANRLVATLGMPTDEARAVGLAGELTLDVDGAVVLGSDAWEALAGLARPLRDAGDRVVMRTEPDGTDSVLVDGRRLRHDRRAAEAWLADRTRWMATVGIDPAGLIAADRWEHAAATGAPTRRVYSVHTALDWGLFAGDTAQPRAPQPWLEAVVDPLGVLTPGARSQVYASGPIGPKRLVARAAGMPQRRVDVDGAGATAYFLPDAGGMALRLGATTDLAIRAIGGPTTHVVVDVPHVEQQAWEDMPPLPNGFEVSVETPDGAPLSWVPVSIGPQDEDRGDLRTIAVRLPVVLQTGLSTVVRVKTVDRHRYSHLKTYASGGQLQSFSFGATTGLVRVLPQVRGHGGGPVPVTLRVGMAHLGRRAHVVTSHGGGEEWADDVGRWVETRTNSASVVVAAGRWYNEEVPAANNVPALGLHPLHGISDFDRVAEQVGGVLDLYRGWLPPYPHPRLEIVESFRSAGGPYAAHAPDLVASGEVQQRNERLTLLGGARLASVLHHQWWHALNGGETSLSDATSWVYALEGLRALEGEREAGAAWRRVRGQIPDRTGWSQTSATTSPLLSLVYALGPVLTADAGGNVALIAAVDLILSGESPPSWEGLGDALETVTGRPWDGFLLTWVYTGATPAVDVVWEVARDRVVGTVTSDLPFGVFTLPVRVDGTVHRVRVYDGVGSFDLPRAPAESAPRVAVDPDGTLPLRRLRVRSSAEGDGDWQRR